MNYTPVDPHASDPLDSHFEASDLSVPANLSGTQVPSWAYEDFQSDDPVLDVRTSVLHVLAEGLCLGLGLLLAAALVVCGALAVLHHQSRSINRWTPDAAEVKQ